MIITLTFENLDREDVRLIAAALRDKREQMLTTAKADPAGDAGRQAHRMAGLVDQVRRVYENAPSPRVHGEYADE